MGMYMKYKYGGWLNSLPTATIGNTYNLNPVTSSTDNVYKLAIPGSNSQYLVFEYRKRGSDVFEAELPGSGLVIYRIYQNEEGNAGGPPDEVYIYRPNGTSTVNGSIAEAPFSSEYGRTEFNAYTNPKSFLVNGNVFQVNINSISEAGETISFTVSATTANLPPVISSVSPVSGSILANEDFDLSVNTTAPNSEIMNVDFYLDDVLVQSTQSSPYYATINASDLAPGMHNLRVTAYSINGLSTSKYLYYKIIDPAQQNWFSWLTDSPLWEDYGRGAVPIKAAIDMDLGDQEYVVKGIRYNFAPDIWGAPAVPGMVNVKINRFAGGVITEQTLLTLGDIYNFEYDPNYVFTVVDTTHISGQIAVILDLFEYQNMRFDINAACGHSWLSEPNRIWTDALGRGIQGAAAIELLLQTPNVAGDDEYVSSPALQLSNHPNPFSGNTTINFSTKENAPVNITIYNLKGQKVKKLLNANLEKGNHSVSWDGQDEYGKQAASGIYFYRLESVGQAVTAKMLRIN